MDLIEKAHELGIDNWTIADFVLGVESLRREVENLTSQLAERERERDELAALNARMLVEYEARMKERDELVADAKRYRWLRSKVQPNGVAAIYWAFPSVYNSSTYWCEQSFDNSIDALAKVGTDKEKIT